MLTPRHLRPGLLAAGLVLCAACGTAAAPSVPPAAPAAAAGRSAGPAAAPVPAESAAPVPHGSMADLVAAVVSRLEADRTSEVEVVSRSTPPGQAPLVTNARTSVVQGGPDGGRMRIVQQGPNPTTRDLFVTELVSLPDEAYVRPDPKARPAGQVQPWVRLDPARADPMSQYFGLVIDASHPAVPNAGCSTELGTASIVATTPDDVDGVPVLRYQLRTVLDDTAGNAAQSQNLRLQGLRSVDSTAYLDAEDRIRRCTATMTLPDGTVEDTDYRLTAYGTPLDITAPPADQVLRLPAG